MTNIKVFSHIFSIKTAVPMNKQICSRKMNSCSLATNVVIRMLVVTKYRGSEYNVL